MFNPYAESLSSTGEPPTESSSGTVGTSAQTIVSSGSESHQEMNNLSLSSGSSRSLSVQEPDSGYEASPSSVAEGHSNQRFFGEQLNASRQSEIRLVNSDEEFDIVECHSQILFSESESELDEYDTCLDCSSSPVSCSCFRTDSSNTNVTAMSNCDTSRCNSSELCFNRPSSQPIQIPNMPSFRFSSVVSSRIVIGSPVDACPLTRSYPTNFSPRLRLDLIPERDFPLSWPPIASNNCTSVALCVSRNYPANRDIPQHTNRHNLTQQHPVRSRATCMPADSDTSSYASSEDEEGPEDVFNMPSGEASSFPTMMTLSGVPPLPDVVLESTDTGRRSRSMSINLPPDQEQAIRDVGRTLRRLSILFEQSRQSGGTVMRARSRTESDCEHLHRNGLS